MTVEELIKELQKFDKDKTVYTEGCDCIGNTGRVALIDGGENILIYRDDKMPMDLEVISK
jgi:replicative superfamily II helicase